MRRFAVLFLLLVLGILSFYSYHKYRQHPPETSLVELRRNVYIITASGLRAGHLSSYLYQPIQTPAMDFLAYDGIRFTNAYTSSTDSLAAHLSLLTGIYPIHEPVKQTYEYLLDFTKRGYPKNLTILPEVLSRRGYRTATFLSDPELRYPGFFGIFFHQAFTGDGVVYPWQASYSPATSCKLARDWIKENREKPHFLLLNFDEPSFPFQPPAPYDRQYAKYPYDGEAAGVDEQVGLFVNLLKETGLYQKSIVILTSPYGESLEGESRYSSPHNAVIQVPLIITAPGLLPRHENYDAQVSIVDIVPTILKLLEYSTGTNFDGISLFEKGQQKQISHEYIYGIVPYPELLNFAPTCFVRGKGYIYVSGRNEDVISHHNYEITESQRNERLQNGRNLLKNAGWKPGANLSVDLETDPGLLLEQALHLARDQKPEIAMDLLSSFTEDVPRNSYLNSLLGSLAGASDDQESELSYFKAAAENSPTLRPLPALAVGVVVLGLAMTVSAGVWIAGVGRGLTGNLVPIKDPTLPLSLAHEVQ